MTETAQPAVAAETLSVVDNPHANHQREEWIEEARRYRQKYTDRLRKLEGADG